MKILVCCLLSALFLGIGDPPAKLLETKWYFAYMRVNGEVHEPPLKVPAAKRPWIHFGKDKSYQQSMDGELERGSWTYETSTEKLTTMVKSGTETDVTVFLLKRVTADSLELLDPDGAVLGMVSK
ncbi:MAG: hypothetical protein EOO15_13665 [Chitinophagaceae bacterium]|nr:MAG: hypothetical protein EOO15_13665 [Chitinophagaceae bacterium]